MFPRRSRSFIVLGAMFLSGCTSVKPVDQGIISVLPGTWGWEQSVEFSCGNNSHTMRFTKDRKFMLLKYKEAVPEQDIPANDVHYKVLQSEPNLRMAIEGEKRTAATGEPVVWDVVMLTPDRFCWHRTDWEAGACTGAVVRCPVAQGSAD